MITMSQSLSQIAPRVSNQPPVAPGNQAPAPPAPPPDPVDVHDITIHQAVDALVGAGVAAGIESVAATASSLVKTPKYLVSSYKALWNTEQIGPVLKATIACTLPPCAVAIPIVTALGAAGYGLFHGFQVGMDKGVVAAGRAAVEDVKEFHHKTSGKVIEAIQEFETRPLKPGEQPYDIKVIEGGRALAAGVVCAAMDGVSVGAITAARTPQGVVRAFDQIWSNEQGPVMKTTESLLVPPAAILATPLATVGGAVVGLVNGVRKGYTEGFGAALADSSELIGKYNDLARKAVTRD